MGTRELLGTADVSDADLAAMVARLLNRDHVELLDVLVQPVDYGLTAITTAGRWWVSGRARTTSGDAPFRLFVKHIQSWARSPLFAAVPEEIRELAEAGVPWRTEALVYRSDLATRLPEGLRMTRALAVHDLDEKSASVWLEPVAVVDWTWDLDRFRRAAHLLGRLAASPRVAPLADVGGHPFTVRDYHQGRFTHQVVPMLHEDDLWRHPLLAAYDRELRERMLAAADRMPAYVEELLGARHLPAHGDACPNNLLGTEDPDTFVLIDFGFWARLPTAFDLGQLLIGEVQLGRRAAASLAETEEAVVPAYVEGLHTEGLDVDEGEVRRLHALHLLLFSGLSCVPFEHLDAAPSDELHALASDRAALTRFSLDLVASAGG